MTEFTKLPDGRDQIIYRQTALKGRATPADLMRVILIAARMQAEKFVEKLSRGAPLDPSEIKALKELADIAKVDIGSVNTNTLHLEPPEVVDKLKQTLYQALTERSKG